MKYKRILLKLSGESRFSGMQIRSLLLLLIFIASCNREDKTYLPEGSPDTSKKISAARPDSSLLVEDPFFVETKEITSTHGPRSITRNVLQDRNGNIWFATWEGIVCYDGKLFTNFTLKAGLRKFHVFSVLEDKAGNLWFGTIRGGAYRYDGTSFTLFTTAKGLANDVILCMLEDKAGNLWFGTDNGVSRYSAKTFSNNGESFTNFTTRDGLSGKSVNSIAQDKTGKLWFGSIGGVNCYDGKSFTRFKNTEGSSFYNVRSIIEDKTGNIWIGSQDGLSRYDPVSGGLTNIATNFTGNIFEDKNGNLWLSAGQGSHGMTLARYNGKSFTEIKSDVQIFGITEDRAGNIWFGTVNGVYCYDGKSFNNYN